MDIINKDAILKSLAKEFERCRRDPIYFINNYVRVKDVGMDAIPLKLYPKQVDLIKAIHNDHRVIVLGSRQTGKTTVVEAYIAYLMVFFENYPILHISRNLDQASTDLKEIKFIIENLPEWMQPKLVPPDNALRKQLENGSLISAQASATESGTSSKGRGLRASFLWIDEAAFVKLSKLKSSVFPVVSRAALNAKKRGLPYGIVLTSTPNGTTGDGKEFYDMWTAAQAAKTGQWKKLEIPDEKTKEQIKKLAYTPIQIHWTDIPVYDDEWYEERKVESGYYISIEKRRDFRQEYELVFLGSRDSLFPDELIEKLNIQKPVETELIKDPEKNITIAEFKWYKTPDPQRVYLIGVDLATKLFGSDSTAIEVVDYDTLEQVGEYHAKCRVDDAKIIVDYLIKEKIPRSVVISETNGLGNDMIEFMTSDMYRTEHLLIYRTEDPKTKRVKTKYGLTTTGQNRSKILDSVYDALYEDPSRAKSADFIHEIPSIKKKGKRYEGEHDDTVMAYGFTTYVKSELKEHLYNIIVRLKAIIGNNYKEYKENSDYSINSILNMNEDSYKKVMDIIYKENLDEIASGDVVKDIMNNPHIEFDIDFLE